MNKKILYIILVILLTILSGLSMILVINTFQTMMNQDFQVVNLMYFVGSIALTLIFFVFAFHFLIKLLSYKEKNDEKDS